MGGVVIAQPRRCQHHIASLVYVTAFAPFELRADHSPLESATDELVAALDRLPSVLAPHLLRGLDDEAQLGLLVGVRDRVALLGRGEPALR
jgi:hypothetical protein